MPILSAAVSRLHHPLVTLEPADEQNVDLLIQWTLDPVAQGPYKRVPRTTAADLRGLFLAKCQDSGRSARHNVFWRMPMLQFDDFEVLTFDCYGTLIDWEAGIWEALRPIFAIHHVVPTLDRTLELYGELETEAEHGEYREYKTILRTVLEAIGARLGFPPTAQELQEFSRSVKNWPAFPDSAPALQALKKKYKLAIISNIDDDLFAYSAQRLQVTFDWINTAQQAKSYKPSLNNFRLAFQRIGSPQNKILHVAQSLFHDIAPAKTLGLSTVWVNRRHNKAGFGATPAAQAKADLEVPDLNTLAAKMGLM